MFLIKLSGVEVYDFAGVGVRVGENIFGTAREERRHRLEAHVFDFHPCLAIT